MTSDSPVSNAAAPAPHASVQTEASASSPTPIRVNAVYAPDLEKTLKQVRSRWYPLQILLFVASAVFLATTRMELWFGLAIMLTTATSTFLIWFQKRRFPWGNIEYFADRVAIEVNDRRQEILFEEIAELRYSLLKWYGGWLSVKMKSGQTHYLPAAISRLDYFFDRLAALRPEFAENPKFAAFRNTSVMLSQYWESRGDVRKSQLHQDAGYFLEVFLFSASSTAVLFMISGYKHFKLTVFDAIASFIINFVIAVLVVYLGRKCLIACGNYLNHRRIRSRLETTPTNLRRDRKGEELLWRRLFAPYFAMLLVLVVGLGAYEYWAISHEFMLRGLRTDAASVAPKPVPQRESSAPTVPKNTGAPSAAPESAP